MSNPARAHPRVEPVAPPDPGCWVVRYFNRAVWLPTYFDDEASARNWMAGCGWTCRLIHIEPEQKPAPQPKQRDDFDYHPYEDRPPIDSEDA